MHKSVNHSLQNPSWGGVACKLSSVDCTQPAAGAARNARRLASRGELSVHQLGCLPASICNAAGSLWSKACRTHAVGRARSARGDSRDGGGQACSLLLSLFPGFYIRAVAAPCFLELVIEACFKEPVLKLVFRRKKANRLNTLRAETWKDSGTWWKDPGAGGGRIPVLCGRIPGDRWKDSDRSTALSTDLCTDRGCEWGAYAAKPQYFVVGLNVEGFRHYLDGALCGRIPVLGSVKVEGFRQGWRRRQSGRIPV